MTLQGFINKLQTIKEELKDTEIVVECPNGLYVSPEVKFQLKAMDCFDITKKNVEQIVITWR